MDVRASSEQQHFSGTGKPESVPAAGGNDDKLLGHPTGGPRSPRQDAAGPGTHTTQGGANPRCPIHTKCLKAEKTSGQMFLMAEMPGHRRDHLFPPRTGAKFHVRIQMTLHSVSAV